MVTGAAAATTVDCGLTAAVHIPKNLWRSPTSATRSTSKQKAGPNFPGQIIGSNNLSINMPYFTQDEGGVGQFDPRA